MPQLMSTGTLWGEIKGITTSTTCDLSIGTLTTLNLTKSSGENYWYYDTSVPAGEYDIKATDTTSGAGGNNQTKYDITVNGNDFVEVNFDIS